MWTPAARAELARPARPYATRLTDAEWRIAQAFLPAPAPCGRPRRWPMRALLDGVLHVLRTGCAWRHLPLDFPASHPRQCLGSWQTTLRWFLRLARSGAFERMAHAPAMADRERPGRRLADRRGGRRAGGPLGRRRRCRAARLRRGPAGGRAQAPCAGGHRWAPAARGRLARRPPRQPRRDRPAPGLTAAVAVHPTLLRRRRLHRAARPGRHGHHRRGRGRQAGPARLRRPAPPMGRRAHLRLDRAPPRRRSAPTARDHEATPGSAIAFFALAAANVRLRRLAKAL